MHIHAFRPSGCFTALTLVATMMAVAPAQEGNSTDRTAEVLDHWSDYIAKLSDYHGEYALTATMTSGNNKPVVTTGQFKVFFLNSDNVYVDYRDGANDAWLAGTSNVYGYLLKPAAGNETSWILDVVAPKNEDDPSPKAAFDFIRKRIDSLKLVSTMPFTLRFSMADLAQNPDRFEVKITGPISDREDKAIVQPETTHEPFEITVTENLVEPIIDGDRVYEQISVSGKIWLDADRYYLPLRFEATDKWVDSKNNETVVGSINSAIGKYQDSTNGLPYLAEVNRSVGPPDPSKPGGIQIEHHYVTQSFDDAPNLTEADFRLPAFGLPEPPEFQRRAWWPYVALALVGLVLIAIALKWNQRRRDAGG